MTSNFTFSIFSLPCFTREWGLLSLPLPLFLRLDVLFLFSSPKSWRMERMTGRGGRNQRETTWKEVCHLPLSSFPYKVFGRHRDVCRGSCNVRDAWMRLRKREEIEKGREEWQDTIPRRMAHTPSYFLYLSLLLFLFFDHWRRTARGSKRDEKDGGSTDEMRWGRREERTFTLFLPFLHPQIFLPFHPKEKRERPPDAVILSKSVRWERWLTPPVVFTVLRIIAERSSPYSHFSSFVVHSHLSPWNLSPECPSTATFTITAAGLWCSFHLSLFLMSFCLLCLPCVYLPSLPPPQSFSPFARDFLFLFGLVELNFFPFTSPTTTSPSPSLSLSLPTVSQFYPVIHTSWLPFDWQTS